jgi:hypothetical protein
MLAQTGRDQKPQTSLGKSIEDLTKIQGDVGSKEQETLACTAAAVFVITHEDTQRSEAINISDLLRMVRAEDVA